MWITQFNIDWNFVCVLSRLGYWWAQNTKDNLGKKKGNEEGGRSSLERKEDEYWGRNLRGTRRKGRRWMNREGKRSWRRRRRAKCGNANTCRTTFLRAYVWGGNFSRVSFLTTECLLKFALGNRSKTPPWPCLQLDTSGLNTELAWDILRRL